MTFYSVLLIFVTLIHSILPRQAPLFTPKDHDRSKYGIFRADDKGNEIFDNHDMNDIMLARSKAKAIKSIRDKGKVIGKRIHLEDVVKKSDEDQKYRLDPMLNRKSWRRKTLDSSESDSSSSSMELKNWKDEWKEHWLHKKFEAINSTGPRGDTVNMAAARPWGLPCGDPNQHDMPWGSCMLPMECEPEYRIFRGDYFCGRTEFVCCGLLLTTYDMYQGFDVSFADSSLATDSEEKKNRDRGSKERKRRQKYRDKLKRKRDRAKRKRKMKRDIKKIVREIRKILNRSYRNGTTEKRRKTKQLKNFVKMLKKKYKEERKVVMHLHEAQFIQTDLAVQEKLNQIKNMNQEFIKNATYRDIIVNGTINEENVARMFADFEPGVHMSFRRNGPRRMRPRGKRPRGKRPRDYLDYDIEYGYLYY